jgi:lysozyme
MSTVGLKAQLVRDEDTIPYAYQDSMEGKCKECGKSNGFWTIATGHLIDRRKGGSLPPHIMDALLEWDITTKSAELYTRFPWVVDLDEPRKATLVNMAFQLGVEGLAQFVRALAFMEHGEYSAAALAFADSRVAREQTPQRWARHCAQIKTGVWQ